MSKLAVVALLVGSAALADTKPKVSVSASVKVEVGTYDAVRATKVTNTAKPKVLACYTSLGVARRSIDTATAKLKLAANGKVSSVTVSGLGSSETDPAHNCIAEAVSALKFAAPKQGAVVDLAVTFQFVNADLVSAEPIGLGVSNLEGAGLGPGAGGGGTGPGTIGIGTIGKGTGGGYGTSARGSLRDGLAPSVSIGQPSVAGNLDKAMIGRYLKRNITAFLDCYEKELRSTPALEGTVMAKFTIASSGKVTAVTATGLGNRSVEACVGDAIRRIEFPRPKQGDVIVSYPVVYRRAP